jgi:aspartokinase/homoserine dehydrogenase 1
MQVLKFGGTSVANHENISRVISIIKDAVKKDLPVLSESTSQERTGKTIIVISALSGITDNLLKAASMAAGRDEQYREKLTFIESTHLETVKQLFPAAWQNILSGMIKNICGEMEDICNSVYLLGELTPRTKDRLGSYGELLASHILSAKLQAEGIENEWKDARELIVTNSAFGNADVDLAKTDQKIKNFFSVRPASLFIVPGFIASDQNGITTTLGRGGSDYSAAIIAAALNADLLQIWTDVSGMMTADPRITANSRIIPRLSYQEAMELSHFGAKVIYPPTIQPVMSKNIPVVIKNTFSPADEGTMILNEVPQLANTDRVEVVRGISSMDNITLISLEGSGMIGIPGFSKRLFEALSNEKINVILITQSSSEHSICVGIQTSSAEPAKRAVDAEFANEIALQKVEPLLLEHDLSIVALVGENMKNHTGISGRMFGVLGRNGVNIRAIAQGSSEKNISSVLSTRDVKKAINVLHEEFFETASKQLNLFIAGTGNVGARLLEQLEKQSGYLFEQMRIQVRIAGLCNSRKMLFHDDGIELSNWKEKLQQGETAGAVKYMDEIISRNMRNSVFVDVTASEEMAGLYGRLLEKSISVVACNKSAASSAYSEYRRCKDLAKEFNSHFLFETNVGAGLPVIGTLNDLRNSGDRVHRIEAVLSGTLNFVFNNYNGTKKFADVVKQAQQDGYTEPDPRLDLGGTDVMRKILILAREAGFKLEMDDIQNNSFMPASCMKGTVEDFYREMEKEEMHFKKIYEAADSKGCKLKFVASFSARATGGKESPGMIASVGLQHINAEHDFYHLYGKDNVVLFFTDRYNEQPLVIKGAGAGADVTASGVFADILRTVKF